MTSDIVHIPDLDELDTHLCELELLKVSQHLGVYQKTDVVELEICGTQFTIQQSVSQLNSDASSTGFMVWDLSLVFSEWLMRYGLSGLVIELGCGISGINSCLLANSPKIDKVVSTDQFHILKLLRKNIESNYQGNCRHKIETCCFDWEDIEQGEFNLSQVVRNGQKPNFIIGCDVVYNDYLVRPLVSTLVRLSDDTTVILIAIQIRLIDNLELFLTELLDHFDVSYESLGNGYVVYILRRTIKQ